MWLKIIAIDKVRLVKLTTSLELTYPPAAHGGMLVSIVLSAVQQHFKTTLKVYSKPDTFNISSIFLRPAAAGAAVVVLKDVKIGDNYCVVHFALIQNSAERIVGYAM